MSHPLVMGLTEQLCPLTQHGSFRNPRMEADLSVWGSEQGALWLQEQVIIFVLQPSEGPELPPSLVSVHRGDPGLPTFSCWEGTAQGRGRPRSPVRVPGAVLPTMEMAIQQGPWWQRPGEEVEGMGPRPFWDHTQGTLGTSGGILGGG